jgi:hypothetical protein
MRTRTLGGLIELNDGGFLILEFQSTAKPSDLPRFFLYGALVAEDYSTNDADAKIRLIIVYSPDVNKLPARRFPRELDENANFFRLVFERILLVARNYMAEFVEKFWPIIADLEAGAPIPALTELDLAKFYFAPMGKIDDKNPGPLAYKFLSPGVQTLANTGDADIMRMAFNGYMARGAPLAAIAIKFWEEFAMMNGTDVKVVDTLTDGQYSRLMKENETLSEENETLSSEIETLTVLAQRAVLAMSAENKSVVEISELLNIFPSEVSKILESAEADQKRPS